MASLQDAYNLEEHAEEPGQDNKCLRHTAYRSFTFWRHGSLGQGNRRVIPSCAVTSIRRMFPSPNGLYTGYVPEFPKTSSKKIRTYNSSFAFASMGAMMAPPPGHGPYCFRIHANRTSLKGICYDGTHLLEIFLSADHHLASDLMACDTKKTIAIHGIATKDKLQVWLEKQTTVIE